MEERGEVLRERGRGRREGGMLAGGKARYKPRCDQSTAQYAASFFSIVVHTHTHTHLTNCSHASY